ncbi:uncharacterized protein LOC131931686 isoform X2 [Physella acuta]|uniref:uncharacterized protein LOC131931686 isoform X2 n=1 Tax=Physella acuta TaxID=109671 RepID=UPI0027DB751E|nr:uncharacterized protein LOC131931686 isoform X2 [Physella acuta]
MMYFLKRRLGYPRPEPYGHNKSVQVKPDNGCNPASMPSPMIKPQSDHVICESSRAEICRWSKDNCFDEGEPLALETPRRMGLCGILKQKAEKIAVFIEHFHNIVFPTLFSINIACLVMLLMCIQMSDVKMKNVCSADELSDLNIIQDLKKKMANGFDALIDLNFIQDLKRVLAIAVDELSDLYIFQKELEDMKQHALSSNTGVSCDDLMKKIRQLARDGKLKTCILQKILNKVMDKAPGNGDDMLLGYHKTDMLGASQNDSSLQKLEVDGPIFHESHLISLHDTRM